MQRLINTISAAAAGTLMFNQAALAQTNETGEIEQVVVTARAQLEQGDPGRGVGHEHVQQPVAALSPHEIGALGRDVVHRLPGTGGHSDDFRSHAEILLRHHHGIGPRNHDPGVAVVEGHDVRGRPVRPPDLRDYAAPVQQTNRIAVYQEAVANRRKHTSHIGTQNDG